MAGDPLIGTVYAERFRVEAFIDSGVMGSVYRARHLEKDRPVALKVINTELVEEEEIIKRFHREMRVTARIKHPNTVRVYNYGHTSKGELYLAMELLEGESLADLNAREAPLDVDRIARIGAQIAAALQAAHDLDIVHRDLKPENIMILPGDVVKVLDFGLARATEADAGGEALTAYGSRVGTPTYMAPEYVRTFELDHRSDLYAVGVLMYEMFTGRPPFEGNPYQVLHAHVREAVPPMEGDPPAWFEGLVMRLLEKEPEKRPSSGAEVRQALEQHADISVAAPAVSAAAGASGPNTLLLAGVGLGVFAAVTVLGLLLVTALGLLAIG